MMALLTVVVAVVFGMFLGAALQRRCDAPKVELLLPEDFNVPEWLMAQEDGPLAREFHDAGLCISTCKYCRETRPTPLRQLRL